MKGVKRIAFIFILCLLLLIPSNIKAIEYRYIYDPVINYSMGDILIDRMSYVYQDEAFGFNIFVTNNYNKNLDLIINVKYYDSDYKELYKESKTFRLSSLDNNRVIEFASNEKDVKDKFNINDIRYYDYSIVTNEVKESSNEDYFDDYVDDDYTDDSFDDFYEDYAYYPYVIKKFDIDMKINENNTFDITENIDVYFNEARHGIFRDIPIRNTISREDGSESKNNAKIKRVSISENYTVSRDFGKGIATYKIGDSNRTITGPYSYTIKYNYDIGKDPLKDMDELYFNIVGDGWDTIIEETTFRIEMPKEFDPSSLGFSTGKKGSTENDSVIYEVNGNVITGRVIKPILENSALTVRLTLPEDYFVGDGEVDVTKAGWYIIPILCLAIASIVWRKYGKDDFVVDTVEFYPPDNLNSIDLAFAYKGKLYNTDVTSLLIYLANKGYISIVETDVAAGLFNTKSKSFKIVKLKEYDGNDINEKEFLAGLFKCNKDYNINLGKLKFPASLGLDNEEDSANEVTESDLKNHFYETVNTIVTNVNGSINKEKIFEKTASKKKGLLVSLVIISILVINTVLCLDYDFDLFFMGTFVSIGTAVFALCALGPVIGTVYVNGKPTGSTAPQRFVGIVFGLMWAGFPFLFGMTPLFESDLVNFVGYSVGLLCICGIVIFIKILPKRTPYGNKMLGRINGFKTFLETAEKDRLEALVMRDPKYFYNILPYTYVLGVSETWIKKFEGITLAPPDWYSGTSSFNAHSFNSFINSTMTKASSSSSSSGGSSGGGHSGGGSGGGGGGSW